MMKILKSILLTFFLWSPLVEALPNISCADIKAYDDANQLYDAYSIWSGCIPQSAERIREVYKDWPIAFQVWARRKFLIPATAFPAPTELESLRDEISDQWSTTDKFLAIQLIQEREQYPTAWKDALRYSDAKNVIEQLLAIYNAWWFYFDDLTDSSPGPIEILSLFRTSDVPMLKAAYGWEQLYGDSLSYNLLGGVDSIITAVSNGWISQTHWMTEAYTKNENELDTSYNIQILKILKSATDQGSVSATGETAEWIADRRIDAQVDSAIESARIWEDLALYGYPYAQMELADRYVNGDGVPENEALGLKWRKKAAEGLQREAIESMFDLEFANQDFAAALKYALVSAQTGYVTIDERGYAVASLLIPRITLDRNLLTKQTNFLKSHCYSNSAVRNKTSCDELPGEVKQFKPVGHLTEAFYDESKIQYASEIKLNTGRFKALIIANQNYTNWDELATPINDAKDLGRLLEEKYGFEVSYVTDASRRDTLKAIYDQSKQLEFNDHFLLFYAGHGLIDRSSDTAYWIPSDAPRDFQPDWISSAEIMTALKSVNARHVLLIADSCYSGKLLRGVAQVEKNPGAAVVERLFSKKAKVAITSGGVEPVADSVRGGKNSVFTEAFLGTLNDIDSPTPASTVFNEILGKVSLKVDQTPQYADMRELDHDGGDFIFVPQN